MQEHHYQALVASVVYVVEAAIHFEDDQQAIENHVDRVLSCYIRKVKPW